MSRLVTLLVWILVIIGLAAVVYFFWARFFAADNELAVGSVATLECTSTCAEHGQCGTTVELPQAKVVLGGLDGPIVEPQQHNQFIPAGVEVTIKDTTSEELKQTNGRQFSQTFSRVEWRNAIGDIQKAGWFADWCVQAPK
jgi:hypothetical protein